MPLERDATQVVVQVAKALPDWPDIALVGILAAALFIVSALTLLFIS